MKKTIMTLSLIACVAVGLAQDAENCKDSPMFPKRMANYVIGECSNNFDQVEFKIGPNDKTIKKEGKKTTIHYTFSSETAKESSILEILKNYEAAAKSIGGVTVYQSATDLVGTYKIMKNGKESAWVMVQCTNGDGAFYDLTILQLEEMEQQVTSNDILNALNKDGHIALYINFETGKSDIKAESQATVDQIAVMMRQNPTLKISIEGHTDNVGAPATNLKLSEARAKAVMDYLIGKKIDASRLTAKGLGQTKPIADNGTEEGKAKNRRVEIVKQP